MEAGTVGDASSLPHRSAREKDRLVPMLFVTGVAAMYGMVGYAVYEVVTGPFQSVLAWVGL